MSPNCKNFDLSATKSRTDWVRRWNFVIVTFCQFSHNHNLARIQNILQKDQNLQRVAKPLSCWAKKERERVGHQALTNFLCCKKLWGASRHYRRRRRRWRKNTNHAWHSRTTSSSSSSTPQRPSVSVSVHLWVWNTAARSKSKCNADSSTNTWRHEQKH